MQRITAVHMHKNRYDVLKVRGQFRRKLLDGKIGRTGIPLVHRGQLKDFGTREGARRVARQGPNEIGNAIPHLAVKLGRGSA